MLNTIFVYIFLPRKSLFPVLLVANHAAQQILGCFCNYIIYISGGNHATASTSGGSSVGQNKLLQLILGYIYISKYLQKNFIV